MKNQILGLIFCFIIVTSGIQFEYRFRSRIALIGDQHLSSYIRSATWDGH